MGSSVQTRRRAAVPRGKCPGTPAAAQATGSRRKLVLATAILGLTAAACSDPRARPVPPTVTITLAPQLAIASPGLLLGSVSVSDANGLDSIHVRVDFGNGRTLGDSLFFTSADPFQATLPLFWVIPGGIPVNTTVKVVARARSYIGYTGADSAVTAVGDTIP